MEPTGVGTQEGVEFFRSRIVNATLENIETMDNISPLNNPNQQGNPRENILMCALKFHPSRAMLKIKN